MPAFFTVLNENTRQDSFAEGNLTNMQEGGSGRSGIAEVEVFWGPDMAPVLCVCSYGDG